MVYRGEFETVPVALRLRAYVLTLCAFVEDLGG